jgi:hypothetical protein
VNQNVALREQGFETFSVDAILKVQPRTSFSEGYFRYYAWLVPTGRVDPQHISAVAGQETGCDRSCENSGQVEYAEASERPK